MTLYRSGFNIARLMPPDLPQYVEPLRLARQAARFSGAIPVADLPRLAAMTHDGRGNIDFEMAFGRDASGIYNISGSFSARVSLICQRCLQPLPATVTARISLGIVQGTQEAKLLPAEYEPLEVGAEPVSLSELIEDEVLLALPFAPLHATGQCPAGSAPPEAVKESVPERQRPFAELIELKRRRKD